MDLISGLNNGSSDSHCAAPKCLELEETANPEAHTSVSEMSNFDSTDSGTEPISCLGLSSIDVTKSSGRGDPPNDVPSGYTGSKLRKTTNLKANTLACSEKSSTSVTPEASLEDTQVSERLYQLVGIIGASVTIRGTLGLWALVVDAPPHDVRATSEDLLATMIKDPKLEEATYDTGSNDGMEVLRGRCT